jgi:hypothetical protein
MHTMTDNEHPASGEILLYQTEDGCTRLECRFEDNTLWLAQALMADLFQTTVPNINLHIDLLERIRASEKRMYLKVRDIFALAADYERGYG